MRNAFTSGVLLTGTTVYEHRVKRYKVERKRSTYKKRARLDSEGVIHLVVKYIGSDFILKVWSDPIIMYCIKKQ